MNIIKTLAFVILLALTSCTERSFIGKWRCHDVIYLDDEERFKKFIEEGEFGYAYEEKKENINQYINNPNNRISDSSEFKNAR